MKKIDMQILPLNGGRFISRGRGKHPIRRIDSDELIYVLHGKLEIFEDKQIFAVNAGEWLILKRGRRHGGLSDFGKDLSFFWVHFIDENNFLSEFSQHGRVVHEELLSNYFQSLILEEQSENSDVESQKLLLQLIFRELQKSESEKLKLNNITPLAEAAHKIIRLRYLEFLNVEIISNELKCNAEYLGKIYKFHYNKGIIQAINELRIEYAARLLTTGNDSIKEIIFRSNFSDPAYFRRQFIRRYAMTPSKFRHLYNHGHVNSD